MTIRNLTTALLITFVLGAGVGLHHYENVRNTAVVRRLTDQLEQTKSELGDANVRLSEANQKLGFLEASKARVQVTAYALTDDFGPDPLFSNNAPARSAYAVPKHALPAGQVLNVALSPMAEQKLHANLNDTIVLMSKNRARRHLARFVDRTAQTRDSSGRGYPVCRCPRSAHLGAAIILRGQYFPARLPISAAMNCCCAVHIAGLLELHQHGVPNAATAEAARFD
jgi:hypothetical protein